MSEQTAHDDTRLATDEEIAQLATRKKSPWSALFFALFVLALLNGVIGAFLTFSLVLMLGAEAGNWIQKVIPLTAIVVTFLIVRARLQERHRVHSEIDEDIADRKLAVMHGRDIDWYYSLTSKNKSSFVVKREFPVLIGDLGDGERIILTGESMFEPEIYGYEPSRVDFKAVNRALNGLPQPFEFPTRDFVIEYWPKSGFLHGIQPEGDPVEPVSIYVDSLHQVGWQGQEVMRCSGDPGLINSANSEPVELSTS